MQTLLPSEFKRGMVLMLDGLPQVLDEVHTSGTAQTKHKIHGRLRNLKTGRFTDHVFAENERIPLADLHYRRVTFSYAQGDRYVFSDVETFDELDLAAEVIGDRRWFIKDDAEYRALFLEGKFLDIVLPASVSLKVKETAPPIRGGFDTTWKEAKMETGIELMVPLFIAAGETIRVDTATRKYLGRE